MANWLSMLPVFWCPSYLDAAGLRLKRPRRRALPQEDIRRGEGNPPGTGSGERGAARPIGGDFDQHRGELHMVVRGLEQKARGLQDEVLREERVPD